MRPLGKFESVSGRNPQKLTEKTRTRISARGKLSFVPISHTNFRRPKIFVNSKLSQTQTRLCRNIRQLKIFSVVRTFFRRNSATETFARINTYYRFKLFRIPNFSPPKDFFHKNESAENFPPRELFQIWKLCADTNLSQRRFTRLKYRQVKYSCTSNFLAVESILNFELSSSNDFVGSNFPQTNISKLTNFRQLKIFFQVKLFGTQTFVGWKISSTNICFPNKLFWVILFSTSQFLIFDNCEVSKLWRRSNRRRRKFVRGELWKTTNNLFLHKLYSNSNFVGWNYWSAFKFFPAGEIIWLETFPFSAKK